MRIIVPCLVDKRLLAQKQMPRSTTSRFLSFNEDSSELSIEELYETPKLKRRRLRPARYHSSSHISAEEDPSISFLYSTPPPSFDGTPVSTQPATTPDNPPDNPPDKKQGSQRTQYLWTLNNYTAAECVRIQEFAQRYCKYLVYGHEVAPTTGTPHLQGYLVLLKQNRGTFLTKNMCARMHYDTHKVYGSAKENREYCLKIREKDRRQGTAPNEVFYEFGECPLHLQGDRTGLQQAVALVRLKGMQGLLEDEDLNCNLAKYTGGMRTIASMSQKKRSAKTHVTVIYGPSGTGKSEAAQRWPRTASVNMPGKGQTAWFDPYDPFVHDTIIFDDYKPSNQFRFGFLLRVLDRHPMTVQLKGDHAELSAKYIVITTTLPAPLWYEHHFEKYPAQLAELDRRLDLVIYTTGIGAYQFQRGTIADLPPGVVLPTPAILTPPPPMHVWSNMPTPDETLRRQREAITRHHEWLDRQRSARN